MEVFSQFVTTFLGFFAIMNPIANTPIFLGLTSDEDSKTRKKIAFNAVFIAFLIVAVFSIMGKIIFEVFGISLPAFKITGGILVAMIGFQMLHGEHSKVHMPKQVHEENDFDSELNIAISPLAMPILAGPGTISTAISYSSKSGITGIVVTLISFAILCVITYLFFVFGEKIIRFLGDGAIKVITRLMGLILAVIGVQMVLDGIDMALKFLK